MIIKLGIILEIEYALKSKPHVRPIKLVKRFILILVQGIIPIILVTLTQCNDNWTQHNTSQYLAHTDLKVKIDLVYRLGSHK